MGIKISWSRHPIPELLVEVVGRVKPGHYDFGSNILTVDDCNGLIDVLQEVRSRLAMASLLRGDDQRLLS